MTKYHYRWADIAFASKRPLKELNATFIAAPRTISKTRFTELVKQYLPTGNIVLGMADEEYIRGFEGQIQFASLRLDEVIDVIERVNGSDSPNKIATLTYRQDEVMAVYQKIPFCRVVFVYGSWKFAFCTRPEYYFLTSHNIPYELASPFCDEMEAREYSDNFDRTFTYPAADTMLSEDEMLRAAASVARGSFDHTFQTGVALGMQQESGYSLLATSYNRVVPYQTFAWHFGSQREKNFSPPGDLNHYDTVHAEAMMLIAAQKRNIDLRGTSFFINLAPCKICARTLSQTDINEFIYSLDHSNGYAVAMLEAAGKTVRRVVLPEVIQ